LAVVVLALLSCGVLPTAALGAGALKWSKPQKFDAVGVQSISCSSTNLCVAGDRAGVIQVLSVPGAPGPSWIAGPIGAGVLGAMACPSDNLCLAGDHKGLVWWSDGPGASSPAWSSAQPGGSMFSGLARHPGQKLPPGVQAIACASVSLCVAAVFPDFNDSIAYGIATTTNPDGGTAAWHLFDGFGSGLTFESASCPAVSLCVLGDQSGSIVWNSNPTGPNWNVVKVDKLNAITALSCPSKSLCVGVDFFGNVIWSATPTRPGWKRALRVDAFNVFTTLSCPSRSLCVAGDVRGNIFVSTRPAGGKSTWRKAASFGRALHISCPTASLCVAVDAGGRFSIGKR
jgi:hypothetical protein